MGNSPQQVLPGGRKIVKYNPILALEIVEKVAAGELLTDILRPGSRFIAQSTFHRWVAMNPELARAYHAAREMSAQAFEEEALSLGRELRKNPGTSQKIRATEVAMTQLRWSAARRDPAKYGDKATVSVRVPVQINTSLDLGKDGGINLPSQDNVYNLVGRVEVEGGPEVFREAVALADQDNTPLIPKRDPHTRMKRVLIPRISPPQPPEKKT